MHGTNAPERPVNYGPLGRQGYILATRGPSRTLAIAALNVLRDRWRANFTWQRGVIAFAMLAFLALVLSHLSASHRAGILAEGRYSAVKTAGYGVRHEQLRLRAGQKKATFEKSSKVRYRERAFVSFGDYWTDYILRTLNWTIVIMIIVLPFIGLAIWWQLREADKVAKEYGEGSPEHKAALDPAPHDWAADEARRDWVLNPPRSERSVDPRNKRRPVFGSES